MAATETIDESFEPDGPGSGDGIFGLPHAISHAAVLVCPVPWEATVSGGHGTARAPGSILAASRQVELWDPEMGNPWRAGIAMVAEGGEIHALNERATADVVMARAGGRDAEAATERVNSAGARLTQRVRAWTEDTLAGGQLPAIVGGDHSVALGGIQAAVAHHPGLGVLHLDAHADLRDAYEGFIYSHASVMYEALKLNDLATLVQVAVRDQCESERNRALVDPRVHQWLDTQVGDALLAGRNWTSLVEEIISPLPQKVWVSCDVDALEPSLCPGTGTPVPGGLTWRELRVLLRTLAESGREIVGLDLCEVAPDPLDAKVGARLLYLLVGWAIVSDPQRRGEP